MSSGFGFLEFKTSAPGNNLTTEFNIMLKCLFKADNPRLPVNQSQHVNKERRLHGGIFIEVIKHRPGLSVLPQFNNNTHTLTVRLITDVTDSPDFLVLNEVRYPLDKGRLVRLVGKLGHHYLATPAFLLIHHVSFSLNHHLAMPGGVGTLDTIPAQNDPRRGKIRPLNKLDKFVNGGLGVINEMRDSITDLA